MSKFIVGLLFTTVLATSSFLAFQAGKRVEGQNKQHPGAEELKLTAANLERNSLDMSPQLREYLKARSYTLLAGGIRKGWVDGYRVDYGPIDRKVLGDLIIVKGPESDEDLYRLAMEAAGSVF